ncbi:hypothetical protein RHSIM_Rhsim13G0202800 [Rhododendron simsii]|uniref:Uncharacterized protein n=1 Tax=Rhododendron simsii TaxID=118357 RepID=A0A834G4V0_RHOSS|nr:hypothetical protein RHSIM_Rhsim13G0202800 [Rhododendron simsii]
MTFRTSSLTTGTTASPNVFSGNPWEAVELFLRAMPENFENGLVTDTGAKITCLLTDTFFWFAANMAAEMGVPWVAFWTAAPCSLSAHMSLGARKEENGDETLHFIPGMSAIRAKDLPAWRDRPWKTRSVIQHHEALETQRVPFVWDFLKEPALLGSYSKKQGKASCPKMSSTSLKWEGRISNTFPFTILLLTSCDRECKQTESLCFPECQPQRGMPSTALQVAGG